MTENDIYRAAEAAARLLLQQQIGSLYALSFLDMRLVRAKGVLIDTVQNFYSRDKLHIREPIPPAEGFSVVCGEKAFLLYDASVRNKRRRNWTIAHEFGHILLKHKKGSAHEEAEADAFAASFLLPEAAIRAMDSAARRPLRPDELFARFSASMTACRTRRAELNARPYFPTAYDARLLARLFPYGIETNASDSRIETEWFDPDHALQ